MALLGPGFLFQGLEQSAAVAVAAEAGMDPEIIDLHTLAPDSAHYPAHQAALCVVKKDGNVSTGIDGRGGDVVGDEFVAQGLDGAVAGVVVYRPMEWRGEVGFCCHCALPPTTGMISPRDLGKGLSRHRGRTAGYPTAPALIPVCGLLAPGSSDLLASADRLMS